MSSRSALLLLCFALLGTAAVLAQPPAETCGAGDSLTGADTMPVSLVAVPASNDFTMTGSGCTEQGLDHVTCLTPTSPCTVQAECLDGGMSSSDAPDGLQIALNVFGGAPPPATDGACTTSPATCDATGSGTGSSGTVTGIALGAGTTYCFECEVGFAGIDLQLQISETTGSCGALPVEIRSFTVD